MSVDLNSELENCLYRAKALSELLYGVGLENFIGAGTKTQDGVLWLLYEEISRANDAYQSRGKAQRGAA